MFNGLAMPMVLCLMSLKAGGATTPRAAYDLYVQSVMNRDIRDFSRSITEGDAFHYLDSKGRRTDNRQEYVDAHRRWFEEASWEISYEPPLIVERDGAAYAMAVFHYREMKPGGNGARLDGYFTLILFREGGEWRAVADIVTPIIREASWNQTDGGIESSE